MASRLPAGQRGQEFGADARTGQGWRLGEPVVERDVSPHQIIPRLVAMGSVWLIGASQLPEIPIFVDQRQE